MPKYIIKKTLEVELIVDCKNKVEAEKWADCIVGTLEDENGNPVDTDDDTFDFECSSDIIPHIKLYEE